MSIICQKKYAMTVADTCHDAFTSSTDTATLVAWQNPAQFAFRYALHATAGQVVTFGIWSSSSISPRWYTSLGVPISDGPLGELDTEFISTSPNTYVDSSFFCLTTGDYVLEVASPVNHATINRASNTITGTLDVITVASPIAHDGSGNFCAVHTFTWNAGDVWALFSMAQNATVLFPDVAVYDNAWNPVTSTLLDDPFFVDSDNVQVKLPSNGVYHVEVSLENGDVGNVWFGIGCGVLASYTASFTPQPISVYPPYVQSITNTSVGQISSQLWTENAIGISSAKTPGTVILNAPLVTLSLDVFRAGIRDAASQLFKSLFYYWKFDEAGPYAPGFQWIDSVNGVVLSVVGGNDPPSIASGLIGNGIFHDGVTANTQGVTNLATPIGYSTAFGQSLTYWINVQSFATGNFVVRIIHDGALTFEIFGNSTATTANMTNTGEFGLSVGAVSSGAISTGSWHLLALTYDQPSKTLKLYIDGSLIGSTVSTITPVNRSSSDLGTQKTNLGHNAFTIDELGVFQKPLSASEISFLWNGGAGQRPTGI